jgi:hypothetical protein
MHFVSHASHMSSVREPWGLVAALLDQAGVSLQKNAHAARTGAGRVFLWWEKSGCVSHLSVAVTKYLREINLKEERCVLAHGFNPFHGKQSVWQRKLYTSMAARKQRE